MLCPFCMQDHQDNVEVCPVKNKLVPVMYRKNVQKGLPVVVMLTIGYPGHGKTCFLSSFFYSLFHGIIAKQFPGLAYIAMNIHTQQRINQEFVHSLDIAKVPPKTPVMFPEPLMLKFQRLPYRLKQSFRRATIEQQDMILLFYDIGGETFHMVEDRIKQNTPILRELNTLIFLISLPDLMTDTLTGHAGIHMHNLLSTIYIALEEMNQQNEKNIIICLTKCDLIWENRAFYGALANTRSQGQVLSLANLDDYLKHLEGESEIIRDYIEREFVDFYNLLTHNFRSVRFTTISALGSQPKDGNIEHLAPTHIFDPFLWMLKLDGHL